MSFLSNKHLIVAMLVAPVLAVLAWLLVDNLIGETPHKAVAGSAYPLVAQSNCRFSSGACDLENNDLKIRLSVDESNRLQLSSSHDLQTATFGMVQPDGVERAPVSLRAAENSHKAWSMALDDEIDANSMVRIAVQAQDVYYYAETVMAFSKYQTIFEKDLRKKVN